MVNFIISEFNPFHNGHEWLLQQIHEFPNICIMSGHITQRGTFAVTDKWTRTAMALHCGADLVLEIPSPFILGSAEQFAYGAVSIIRATGLDGRLCFGTEGEVLPLLQTLAAIPEEKLSDLIKKEQKIGFSHAAAVQNAYRTICPEYADILLSPNNLLALEYLKAAPEYTAFATPRKGAGHNDTQSIGSFCSAGALRENITNFVKFTPSVIHSLYREMLRSGAVLDTDKFNLICMHALRSLSAEQWENISPGGIGQRFYKAVSHANTIEEMLAKVKTKCCTLASLRRLTLKAFLGSAPKSVAPSYIRLLGCNSVGRELLKQMTPSLPILNKPAAVKNLSPQARQEFCYEQHITDSFCYCLRSPRPTGQELSNSPILLL